MVSARKAQADNMHTAVISYMYEVYTSYEVILVDYFVWFIYK